MKTRQYPPLILLAVVWAVYYVASKVALTQYAVFFVGMGIRMLAFIGLSVLILVKGEAHLLFKIRGIWPRLICIGILGFLLDLTAFLGLRLSTASNGVVLLKSDILFANLITILVIRERFNKYDWIFSIAMLFGVFRVMDVNLLKFRFHGIGDAFFILSAFFVTVNAFIIKSVQLDRGNPARDNVVAFYNNLICLVLFTSAAWITGDIGSIRTPGMDALSAGSLLVAGLGQTFIYVVYYYNLRRLPVWIVKIFLLLMPVFAIIISHFVLKEILGTGRLAGVLIVLGGAAGIVYNQHKKNDGSGLRGVHLSNTN